MKLFAFAFLLPFVIGQDCPTMPAAPDCGDIAMWGDGAILCPGPTTTPCPVAPTCMPKPTPECAAICPTYCGQGEIMCPGPMAGGCPTAGTCIAPAGDCPVNCPANCAEGDVVCPGPAPKDGCPGPDVCYPGNRMYILFKTILTCYTLLFFNSINVN